jgi:hypothetical protein
MNKRGLVVGASGGMDRTIPERMIEVNDIADLAFLAIDLSKRACVTEMSGRPKRPPYR